MTLQRQRRRTAVIPPMINHAKEPRKRGWWSKKKRRGGEHGHMGMFPRREKGTMWSFVACVVYWCPYATVWSSCPVVFSCAHQFRDKKGQTLILGRLKNFEVSFSLPTFLKTRFRVLSISSAPVLGFLLFFQLFHFPCEGLSFKIAR